LQFVLKPRKSVLGRGGRFWPAQKSDVLIAAIEQFMRSHPAAFYIVDPDDMHIGVT